MERTDLEGKQMLLTIVSILDRNPAIELLRPAFTEVKTNLKIIIRHIIDAQTGQSTPTAGDAIDKGNKFKTLGQNLFIIASAASAYASKPSVNDPILKAKVNFTIDQILKVNYNKIEAFATNIIAAISPTAIISNLGPYGVTTIDLDATSSSLAAFLLIQNAPQDAITDRTVITASIHPFVVEGKLLLDEQGDPIANTMFLVNNTLYNLWYSGRPIVHLPHGTTVAEGFVYEADGTTPIYNAEIKFAPQGYSVQSFLDGCFQKPHFHHGVTTSTATADGKQPNTTAPKEIKQGHNVKFIFKMLPL